MRADEPVDCLGQIRIPVRYRLLLQPGREGGIRSSAHSSMTGEGGDESGKRFVDRKPKMSGWRASDGEPAERDPLSRGQGEGKYLPGLPKSSWGF